MHVPLHLFCHALAAHPFPYLWAHPCNPRPCARSPAVLFTVAVRFHRADPGMRGETRVCAVGRQLTRTERGAMSN